LKRNYLIGVDLGTSATKAALYSVSGSPLGWSRPARKCRSIILVDPGVVEQENDDFYRTASATVRQCTLWEQSGIDPRQVAALAFDSQMAGIGSIDQDFHPATRFDSWLDMRCQPYIEMMDRMAGDSVIELTGCAPTCDHGPKILWWMHESPPAPATPHGPGAEFGRVAKFVTPAGYVAGTMVGLKAESAFMDYTFIHFTGFSDSRSLTWSRELCGQFGLDPGLMPRIVEPWHVVGEVTPVAAREFGLAPPAPPAPATPHGPGATPHGPGGTPVAAGCGDTIPAPLRDTAACALGAGVVAPGMVFDSAGTAAVLAACTDRFVADRSHRALLCMHSVIPGLYNPLAYIAGGGLALRWFRDRFYNTWRGKPQILDCDLYEEMIAAAGEAPPPARSAEPGRAGAEELFFSPHLGGRICGTGRSSHARRLGPFSWGHSQAHFARALLESIAYEYAFYLSIDPSRSAPRPRAEGGASRRRRGAQPRVEPDQGRRAEHALSTTAPRRAWHLGQCADRGEGGRLVRRPCCQSRRDRAARRGRRSGPAGSRLAGDLRPPG
jgi:xylulokinase